MTINTNKSFTEYTVDTPTGDFQIGFSDFEGSSIYDSDEPKDTVNVTVDDVSAEEKGYRVFRKNNLTIALEPLVKVGVVRLQRETNIDTPFYKFTAGALFEARTVDENFLQVIHSQQEIRDLFDKLYADVIGRMDGFDGFIEKALDAANRAEEAARRAEEAANLMTTHNNLKGRDEEDAHPASAVSYDISERYPANTVGRGLYDLNRDDIPVYGHAEFDEFSIQSSVKINGVPLKRPFNMRNYKFERPKDFTWDVNKHSFWLDAHGITQTDINPSDYDVASKNNPVEYFVSHTGTNTASNTGTDPTSPLRSITRALYLITNNNVTNAVIWIQAGRYSDGNTWGTTESVASNVSIKVWNMSTTAPFKDTTGASVILPTDDTTLVYTADTTGVWKSNRSGVSSVVDDGIINVYGDGSFYEKALTLDDCRSTVGTWFQDASTLYVHTLDNRKPDSKLRVYLNKPLGRAVTGNYNLYIEGVWFYGGVYPFSALVDAGSTVQTVFLKDCRFWYGAENGLSTRGVSLVVAYNCSCAYNRDDGFNYHSEFAGLTRPPKTIEFRCTGYRNGQTWSPLLLSNQGSTTHDGAHIARAGCTYYDNGRQSVTDVGGSQSWIMDCRGYAGAKRFEGSYYSVFQCAAGSMWLDHCDASDHDYCLASTNNGKIYVRRSNIYPRMYTAHNVFKW